MSGSMDYRSFERDRLARLRGTVAPCAANRHDYISFLSDDGYPVEQRCSTCGCMPLDSLAFARIVKVGSQNGSQKR